MVDGRTWKRNGEGQQQSRGEKEADLSTATNKKRTKTEKIGSWKFRQVKQAKEEELFWHLCMEGDRCKKKAKNMKMRRAFQN